MDENSSLVKRLDAIISLQLLQLQEKNIEVGKLFTNLHNAGLAPTEIGKLVGRKPKDVSATIAMYKKKINKQRGKKKIE